TLVDDLVNDPGALAEVFLQRGDVSIQAAEQEAAVAFEARQALEVMGTVGVELLRITALLLIPRLEQLAVVAESPAVERAGEGRLVTPLLAAQGGATVRTGVEQRLELPVLGAGDHHRLTTYGQREIVTGIRYLALMGQEHPVTFEDVFHLQLEQLLIGERPAVATVAPGCRIGFHRTADQTFDLIKLTSHDVTPLVVVRR